jgi:hypothetical protein
VSGFGGTAHENKNQFIDLVSVTSAANTISTSYLSANALNTSGTLFVSSGGVQVAAITMVGHYSAGNFVITSGAGGTVEITDPAVPNGGSVAPAPAQTLPRQGIDLPNIAFGAQTTLAYSENATGNGGTPDRERRPPCREHCAPRQLHGRKLRHHGRRPRRHPAVRSVTERAGVAGAAAARVTGGGDRI